MPKPISLTANIALALIDTKLANTVELAEALYDEFMSDLSEMDQVGFGSALDALGPQKAFYFFSGFLAATRYWRSVATTKEIEELDKLSNKEVQ